MNRPVRKMVLERIVPGGIGFGANRPVTLVREVPGHPHGMTFGNIKFHFISAPSPPVHSEFPKRDAK